MAQGAILRQASGGQANPARQVIACNKMDELDRARFEFEREKWHAEQGLRERAQANADAELELRRLEQRQSRWRSPLEVAIFAAAVAAAGNAVVALVNGRLERDLELRKAQDEQLLEGTKAEATRILEMIKTGDPEAAAVNLTFLVDSGLIDDAARVAKLKEYLANRGTGQGVALPAQNAQYLFEQTPALSGAVKAKLDRALENYIGYLQEIGLQAEGSEPVAIRVEENSTNSYYEPATQTLVIDPKLAADPEAAMREFSHHALLKGREPTEIRESSFMIEYGLADYFPCSFLNNPRFGEVAAKLLHLDRPFVRNLENDRLYTEISANPRIEVHQGGEIWDGALWEIRKQLGRGVADPLIVQAWHRYDASGDAQAFVSALLAEASATGSPESLRIIRDVLTRRQFPVPPER
jgi:hypothetical protein